ncbi:MAG: sigma-54-dependent Fis family transcriptional regulator [Planctomycetaceae bacterium]|nr:sigma-54-dependent Fis family transcriptional regulator [Planctomycetaceae bacterium]
MSGQWVRFSDALQSLDVHEAVRATGFLDRCLQSVAESPDEPTLLGGLLPELVTEFSAQWCGVLVRKSGWDLESEYGRQQPADWPIELLQESLDREAAGGQPIDNPNGWTVAAVPLDDSAASASVLLLAGGHLDLAQLPLLAIAGRGLSVARDLASHSDYATRRADRLAATLKASAGFAGVHEMVPLLEQIADVATDLLACDRASIFVHDQERNELVACPALGVDSGTLRIPDDAGIVGDVIRSGQAVQVDDVTTDERFNPEVDKETGYTTRNLLCVPLRDGEGEIMGAFELINRLEGHFDQDDLEALEHLAGHAAVALANTREHQRLSRSRDQLTEQVARGARLIGNSPAIIALRDTIERLANTDLPVLVLGASGTGKEVVSRALHVGGSRADQPFVAVNCAAISETLLESELFGHEKGAFTDAAETRKGKFELADEGTLFLDEIGDMSPGGQAKLLRVLEQKVITRVGGSQTIPINVRVIAATNQDLSEAVGEKRFREDLFYRLSVVTLELPPLSDRPEDILPLAEHFLGDFCVEAGRSPLTLAPEAQQRLTGHTWPGNVRELRNLMERVAFLCPGDQIEIDDLAFILAPGREPDVEMPADAGLAEATRRFQVDYIRRSIRLAANNMTEAARLLGLHRSNLYRKMGQLEMTESEQEPPTE